jgi:hypothetical protein
MNSSTFMTRARIVVVLLALIAATAGIIGPPDAKAKSAVGTPTVEGPIGPDAGQGRPFQYQGYDLTGLGYAEEEFFVSGSAVNLAGDAADYRTRILVYRPLDADRFNGTVVLEWDNVTQQFGIPFVWNWLHPMVFRDGYAYAFVAAQSAEQCGTTAPTGGTQPPPTGVCNPQQLKGWDPERYASLSHPGDDWSFDVFSQVANAVRGQRSDGSADPMAGLRVDKVIATGNSQSASRLSTYVAQVQAHADVIDAFLIDAGGTKNYAANPAVPVIHVQSEAEMSPAEPTAWPNYRLWEIAGGSHGDYDHTTHPATYTRPEKLPSSAEADFHAHEEYGQHGPSGSVLCAPAVGGNQFPRRYSERAALDHLNRWARAPGYGRNVPQPDRVVFDANGNPARDLSGNTVGGLRLPPIEVPVATYLGEACGLLGSNVTFDPVRLALRYPSHDGYVMQMSAAIDTAVSKGYMLAVDGADLLRLAQEAPIGA